MKKKNKKVPINKQKRKVPLARKHDIQTNYLGNLYSKKFLEMVPAAVKAVKAFRRKHPFDALAFSGSSGAGIAFPLSYLLKLPLIHVRKTNSSNNYRNSIEGSVSSKRYLIVDDLISSGETVDRIRSVIRDNLKSRPPCVGIFLYNHTLREKYHGVPVISLNWPLTN